MFTEGMAFRLNLIGRFALVNIALRRPHNVYTFATGTCSEGSHRTPCKRGWHISAAANTVARYEPRTGTRIRMPPSMHPSFAVCDAARCSCISVLARRAARQRFVRMASSRSRLANCCIGIMVVVQQRKTIVLFLAPPLLRWIC